MDHLQKKNMATQKKQPETRWESLDSPPHKKRTTANLMEDIGSHFLLKPQSGSKIVYTGYELV